MNSKRMKRRLILLSNLKFNVKNSLKKSSSSRMKLSTINFKLKYKSSLPAVKMKRLRGNYFLAPKAARRKRRKIPLIKVKNLKLKRQKKLPLPLLSQLIQQLKGKAQ